MTPQCPYQHCTRPADTTAFTGKGGAFCHLHAAKARGIIANPIRRQRYGRISSEERAEIIAMLVGGATQKEVAAIVGKDKTTIGKIWRRYGPKNVA